MTERWIPVADGLHSNQNIAVAYDGRDIGIKIDGCEDPENWANNYEWLGDGNKTLASDLRLCALTPVDERMPAKIAETMRLYLMRRKREIELLEWEWSFPGRVKELARIDAALAYLDGGRG